MTARLNEFNQPIGPSMDDWTPRNLPPKSQMCGKYCRIEPLDPEVHTNDLWEAFSLTPDGRDWTYLLSNYPPDYDNFSSYIKTISSNQDPMPHAIINLKTNKAVGLISFMRIDPKNGSIEIGGINFSELLKRTPQSTEAIYLMSKRAIDELGYRRLEWKCDTFNQPSRNAAIRYGFTFEGIFRNALVYKGRSRDTAWYSIIDTEWAPIREAYETWLDASNFSEDGTQKTKLSDLMSTAKKSSE